MWEDNNLLYRELEFLWKLVLLTLCGDGWTITKSKWNQSYNLLGAVAKSVGVLSSPSFSMHFAEVTPSIWQSWVSGYNLSHAFEMCLGVALGSLSHLFLFCTGVQDSQTSSGKRKTPFHLSSAPILYKSGLRRELVGGHSLISHHGYYSQDESICIRGTFGCWSRSTVYVQSFLFPVSWCLTTCSHAGLRFTHSAGEYWEPSINQMKIWVNIIAKASRRHTWAKHLGKSEAVFQTGIWHCKDKGSGCSLNFPTV